MRLWKRRTDRIPPPTVRDHAPLPWTDYQGFFGPNGLWYPLVQTSMSGVKEEMLPATSVAAMKQSSPVFSLVMARVQVFSQARFQWTQFKGGAPGDLFGSPELAVLDRPWPGGTTADLLARMEMDVSTAGNCYVRRHGGFLHRLHPEWVTIVLGSEEDADHPSDAADTTVLGYMYKPPSARAQFFLPNEVAHYAPIPDPNFNYLGMSWITPVIRDVQGDAAQTEHKLAFLKNAATPNLAVRFDPAITPEQIRAYREIFEEEHTGLDNAWKTVFIGGGADTTVIGKDFKELDFAATQGKSESRLASAAGVPPSWVGFSEGLQGSALNAGNFTSQRRRLSDGTMAHLWGNAAGSLQSIVRPPNSGASLWYTTAGAPFMREDAADLASIQAKQATTIRTLVDGGYTPESAVHAVQNNDMSLLKHTGLFSVQLQPPSNGKEPDPAAAAPDGGSAQ